MSRTVLYARVSTVDQTVAHQKTQAEQAGFHLDDVVEDSGVSGVTTALRDRPGGRRLFDLLRAGDVLVVRWVDRLGRSYDDACESVREFMRRGVVIRTVIGGMVFDGATADPVQKAIRDTLIAFLSATAEAQAEATKQAQRAGIAHARATDPSSFRGRKPSFGRTQLDAIRAGIDRGAPIAEIARAANVSRQLVHRVRADPAAAEKMLAVWGG